MGAIPRRGVGVRFALSQSDCNQARSKSVTAYNYKFSACHDSAGRKHRAGKVAGSRFSGATFPLKPDR